MIIVVDLVQQRGEGAAGGSTDVGAWVVVDSIDVLQNRKNQDLHDIRQRGRN
jgi:hypothetical protein